MFVTLRRLNFDRGSIDTNVNTHVLEQLIEIHTWLEEILQIAQIEVEVHITLSNALFIDTHLLKLGAELLEEGAQLFSGHVHAHVGKKALELIQHLLFPVVTSHRFHHYLTRGYIVASVMWYMNLTFNTLRKPLRVCLQGMDLSN